MLQKGDPSCGPEGLAGESLLHPFQFHTLTVHFLFLCIPPCLWPKSTNSIPQISVYALMPATADNQK